MDKRVEHGIGVVSRLGERLLPIPLLLLWILPAAMTIGRRLVLRGISTARLDQLPRAIRPRGTRLRRLWRLWVVRVNAYTSRFLCYWPERLREPRWARRCRLVGLERLEAPLAAGRPVILVTLHYGDLPLLYHWLRSRGIGVAFLSELGDKMRPAFRDRLDSLADRANGLDGVPRQIRRQELWDARDFMATPGRVLAIPMESATDRDLLVSAPGCSMYLSPGAIRMAAIVGAVVLPCLFSSDGCMRSMIRFGTPVPEDDIASRKRHLSACEHIARELIPWVAQRPEECGGGIMASFDAAAAGTTPQSSRRPREGSRS